MVGHWFRAGVSNLLGAISHQSNMAATDERPPLMTTAKDGKPAQLTPIDYMLAIGKLVLAILGCDGHASEAPPARFSGGRKTSPIQLKVYTDLGEDLLRRQIEFRSARTISRRREHQRRLSCVRENVDAEREATVNLKMAAAIVLQTYVRMLRSEKNKKTPAYRRGSWVVPDAKEMQERISNLQERFPELSPETLSRSLSAYNGHGGYAASALLSGGRRANFDDAEAELDSKKKGA